MMVSSEKETTYFDWVQHETEARTFVGNHAVLVITRAARRCVIH
jgi:hypothetical protein